MEVTQSAHQEHQPDEPVEAEFVEASVIRRSPDGLPQRPTARVSMDLTRWLEVDQQLHELWTLIEVAIQQRDTAKKEAEATETVREVTASRLREWKAYARSLERRLHEAQIENLELSFAVKQAADIAAQALATPRLGASRRRAELRERLVEVGDGL